MGGMGSILSMMPGVGSQLSGIDMDEGERSCAVWNPLSSP